MYAWTRYLLIGGVLLSTLVFTGCGNTSTSNSGPVTQPIQQPTTTSKQTQHHQSTGAGSGNTTTGHEKSNSQSTAKSGQNAKSGSTPSQTVTINVGPGQGTPLTTVPVHATGTGVSFVPVSQSVTAVQLPQGWTMQSNSYASSGTTIKWIDPNDPSQYISESIQPFTRNLSNFYAAQTGAVRWLVPNQVVEFHLVNPNNPNPDIGIVSNKSSGGSIRLDVYLPAAQKNEVQAIIHSFVTPSN